MQTIPAYAYLLPLVLLFGIGAATALIATADLRAAARGPPHEPRRSAACRPPRSRWARVRVDATGRCCEGPASAREALDHARASTRRIMMAIGMVVIAAIVGAPGLGRDGPRRPAAPRRRCGAERRDRDRGDGDRPRPGQRMRGVVRDRACGVKPRRSSGESSPGKQIGDHRRGGDGGRRAHRRGTCSCSRTSPRLDTSPSPTPTNTAVEWIQTRRSGDLTSAISDFLADLLPGPDPRPASGRSPGGCSRAAWRSSPGGCHRMEARAVHRLRSSAIGCSACGTDAMDTLSQVLVVVVIALLLAIPIGVAASRGAIGSRSGSCDPILDAMQDDAGVRVPRPGDLLVQARSRARRDRVGDLRLAGGHPDHQPGDPPGATQHRGGRDAPTARPRGRA